MFETTNTIANLMVKIGADTSQLQSGLDKADKSIAQFAHNGHKSINAFGQSLDDLGPRLSNMANNVENAMKKAQAGSAILLGGVAALGAGLVAVGAKSIKAAADLEQTATAFKTMLGSAEKATKLLKDLQKFAASTPFEFTEITAASKKLLAFGVQAEDITDTLKALGDVSSGVGAPIGEIAELYGKAKVQGRLFAEDINQLTGRGIPIIQELAKQFGVADSEVKNLVETGQIGFPQLEQAFKDMTAEGSQFGGLMEEQSKTLGGMWSNLMDGLSQSSVVLGQELIEAFDIKDKLQVVIDGLGKITELLQSEGLAGALDKLLGEETQTALAAITGGILFGLIPAFLGLAAAIGAALLPLVPFIIAGMAVGVITFIVMNPKTSEEKVKDQGGIGGGGGSGESWGDKGPGAIESAMGEDWAWFGSWADDFIAETIRELEIIGGAIEYWAPRIQNAFAQAKEVIGGAVESVKWFMETAQKAFELYDTMTQITFQNTNGRFVGAGIDVSNLGTNISNFVINTSGTFSQWGANIQGVFTWFYEMIETSKVNINSGADVIKNALNGAGEWWVRQFDTAVDFFVKLPERAYQWGVDIITRLRDGIGAVMESVGTKVSELVELVKTKFLEGFGIHSPSDFMIYVANNLMDTLLDNLDGSNLVSFVENLVQQIKDAFGAGNFDMTKALAWLGAGAKDILAKMGISLPTLMGLLFPTGTTDITSYFGWRTDPITGEQSYHEGVDIGAAYGEAVGAAAAGIVTYAGENGGWGNMVKIDHGGGLETLYAHLSAIMVSVGDAVAAGQKIGEVGSTGRSTGAHLHWGVYQDGVAIDPLTAGVGMNAAGGDVGQWITAAINATGAGMENFQHLYDLAMAESSGNPNAINDWDSNWYAGTPSMGLMQTIQSTFDAYALPGYGDIWNPIANAIAAIRYMIDVYGSIANTPLTGYETGTNWVPKTGPYILHEGEAVVTRTENEKRSTERQPMVVQLVLQNGARLAEYMIEDINNLLGEQNAAEVRRR